MAAAEQKSFYPRRDNDLDVSDLGRPDTLRYNILSFVINEEYERAIKTLREFLESDSNYPNFKNKVERYTLHTIDLIYAIRTKRNFPGINALTRTKQQELKDKFKEHFKELKLILKKIESCLEELRLNDVKSTRILVNAFWLSALTLFISGVAIEIFNGLGRATVVVADEALEKTLNWIFKILF
ncbi:MAG: hypothetical protein A2622_12400 [Bdellovibrionales bacterium RIFCSPHIGHO2_01_FULL_40_29]|nr:MAG: hypothetical protein A2622_12400 [Bdellovibrionales bacterium RIFCSPHIGHO2_01_FULL_40_29]OFZ32986.1 MAG: hypothetical protein A3D17_09710 [Bdellovibrionales bacterium RIFCSPHIGHO2_02_FULL_40_15]